MEATAASRWASVVVPGLTVIEQPVEQLGEVSLKLLLVAIEHSTTGQHVVLESRLVLCESHWRQSRVQA